MSAAPKVVPFTTAGLAMVATTYGIARYCFGLFIPDIRSEFNITLEYMGLMASSSYVGYLLAMFPGAWLSTACSPKHAIIVGGLMATSGMLIIALSPSPLWLTLGVTIAGASPGFAYPPYSVLVKSHFGIVTGEKIYAWINSGTGFGVALACPIMLWAGVEWRYAWSVFALLSMVITMVNLIIIDNEGRIIAVPSVKWRDISDVISSKRLHVVFLSALIYGVVTSIYWTFAVDLMHQQSSEIESIALFWIAVGVAGAFGCFTGNVVNRIGLVTSYRCAIILTAISIMSLPVLASISTGAYVSGALFGLTFISTTALFGMWTIRLMSDSVAFGFAATFFLISFGQGIGAMTGGFLEPYMGYAALFLLAAIVCSVLCILPQKSFQSVMATT